MPNNNISLLSYFGAALVINLAERTDRRRLVEREFRNIGWKDFKIFPAARFDEAAGFKFASWRGCFYSHLGCLKFAQKNNLKSVLVFEDDIALSPSIPRLTPIIIENIRKLDWDILYFGHHQTGDIAKATSKTTSVVFERCNFEFPTAHFYAINRRIIPRLIEHYERIASGIPGDEDFGPMPVDGAMNTFRRNNQDVATYLVNPKLGWQRSSRSDISPHPLDHIKAFRPFISLARSVKHFLNFD